ncbi:N-acetyltransferase family protein [Collinsella tanakaei]|uniref:GNAT family N-acetyltransferase n=1 Tax=Collinsella tanakaei TaxID=626935 RepID=UPI0025A46E81|nr:GNAT family N-acetyltransferase [Collinsella tanakaei]MDM8246770.1 N-acetyltransferase family protein [Collinsella tanakaei]
MSYRIRTARSEDAAALAAIYAPFVTGTVVSFEFDAPSVEEFQRRIEATSTAFAYVVAEVVESGEIAGYAYYGTLRSRPAYQWAAETSIYLAPAHQGRGLGSVLVEAIERLMAAQGIALSVACITSDNTGSIAFHERLGYEHCGEFCNCAFKLGRWLSVTWMEKQLLPCTEKPAERRTLTAADIEPVLAAANERLAAGGR